MISSLIKKFIKWFLLPELKDIPDLDADSAALIHAKIIQKKPLLRKLYIDFYRIFKKMLGEDITNKVIVELGSGAGFIKEIIPSVITSDLPGIPNVDRNFSALDIPFDDNSVDSYLMLNIVHHIPDIELLFKELDRTLTPGGKIIMIEPANTLLNRCFYRNFHYESFDLEADWKLAKKGRLTSANGALPWIIFVRDRRLFEKMFPLLKIVKLEIHTPFRYIVSGGFSARQLLPGATYNIIKALEMLLSPLNRYLGMSMTVVIRKES